MYLGAVIRHAAVSQSISLRTKLTAMKYYNSKLNFNSCNKTHTNTEKVERALKWDKHVTQQADASIRILDLRYKYTDKKNEHAKGGLG